MHPQHYSPETKLLLVSRGEVPLSGAGAYLQLHFRPRHEVLEVVHMPDDAAGYAVQLYRVLHELDALGYDWIAVDEPDNTPAWEAVRDRLTRASNA
jgi:L-threonylcarbamoyladenylate synthase